MALPVITGVWRCALLWDATDSSHAVNVMHVRGTELLYTDVRDAFVDNVQTGQFAGVSELAHVPTMQLTPLDGTSPTRELSVTGWVGEGGSDFIPQAAGIVKWNTDKRGRSYRGRNYLPYAPESGQSGGSWVGDTITVPQTAWELWLAGMGSAGVDPVIASYKHATAELITSVTWEKELGTMRPRQERNRK
jgi:hypothetical protein